MRRWCGKLLWLVAVVWSAAGAVDTGTLSSRGVEVEVERQRHIWRLGWC